LMVLEKRKRRKVTKKTPRPWQLPVRGEKANACIPRKPEI